MGKFTSNFKGGVKLLVNLKVGKITINFKSG